MDASPTIAGNVITANTAPGVLSESAYGAGAFCSVSDALIVGNVFSDNRVDSPGFGGGIFLSGGGVIEDNEFLDNEGGSGGGGVLLRGSPVLRGNYFSGNGAQRGGAIGVTVAFGRETGLGVSARVAWRSGGRKLWVLRCSGVYGLSFSARNFLIASDASPIRQLARSRCCRRGARHG